MMFKIIESSSAGNCFLLDTLMIDLGLPYSKTKKHLKSVDFVLLTHSHGDHFNTDAIRKIFVYHENIIFVCGEWLRDKILKIGVDESRLKIIEFGKVYELGDYRISPIIAFHDVENCGYRIMKNGFKHLHITDTCSLDGVEAKNYNSASIECNHHYDTALKIIDGAKENNEFSHLRRALNSHLAVHETIEFCKRNGIETLYPVHIGSSTKNEVIEALRRW